MNPASPPQPVGFVPPMLATAGPLPAGGGGRWSAEVKWDGIRLITAVTATGQVRCWTRTGRDVTSGWNPVTTNVPGGLAGRSAVLDGEIVALGADGAPSFGALQHRETRPTPLVLMVFDLLQIDGRDLTGLPWHTRRAQLEDLDPVSATWQLPAAHPDPAALYAFTAAHHLEGVVCKRRDSPYRPGYRSTEWIKVKHVRTQDAVLGGWLPGQGHRSGDFGALLLGLPDPTAAGGSAGLRYIGRVGTGFTAAARRLLLEQLRPLATGRSPFTEIPRLDARDATWVRPVLVGEVAYTEWTAHRRLRHPVWRGLRDDITPDQVHEGP